MLTKVNDVIFQCFWRHSCQFKPQKFSIDFWRSLVPPHFEKGSATHGHWHTQNLAKPLPSAFCRGVYFGCARCAAHTLWNRTWRDIFQIVRSSENHKKARKTIMYFPARRCALFQAHTLCTRLLSYSKRFAQTAFAFVSCAVPGLNFTPLFVSFLQPWVCDIPYEHLQGWKTRNPQDIASSKLRTVAWNYSNDFYETPIMNECVSTSYLLRPTVYGHVSVNYVPVISSCGVAWRKLSCNLCRGQARVRDHNVDRRGRSRNERTVKFFSPSPVLIRNNGIRPNPNPQIFDNHRSHLVLIRQYKAMYF